jgi:adenosylcobinamide-GDP ribazoletransferase
MRYPDMEKTGRASYKRSIAERKSAPAAQRKPKTTSMIFDPSALFGDTARALGFLSRLPIPARYFEGENLTLARASRAFPLAGLICSMPAALFVLMAPWMNFPPLLAALVAVAISAGATGALHEDGLADMADGFFGGKDSQHRLDIMKDSRIGTYGALTLCLSVLMKTAAIASILSLGGLSAGIAVLAAGVAGRTALVWHWAELDSARPGGVADKAGKPDDESVSFALVTGVALAVIVTLTGFGFSAAVLTALLVVIASVTFVRLCRDKIGGFTGDTLGAATQIAEIAALIALACSH